MRYCKTCKEPEYRCICDHEDRDFVDEALAVSLGISLLTDLLSNDDSSSGFGNDNSGSSFGGFDGGESGGSGAGGDY